MDEFGDSLRRELQAKLQGMPQPAPDVQNAKDRGRMLRRRRLAISFSLGVIALAGVYLAATSLDIPLDKRVNLPAAGTGTPVQGWEANRAASFSVRSIAQAGLLNPTGDLYDYRGIETSNGTWTAQFAIYDCAESDDLGRCVDSMTEATLQISVVDGQLTVSEAFGPFSETERQALLQYNERFEPEPARFEFPSVDVSEFKGGSIGVQGVILWTGPIPYTTATQKQSCEALVRNAGSGSVAFRGSAGAGNSIQLQYPSEEGLRSGGIAGIPVPRTISSDSKGEILCEPT